MVAENKQIIVEETFDAPAQKVWKAITELDEMKQWFFENIPAFEPTVDFETEFSVQSGERIFTHLWKLIEVVPGQKIVYKWQYEDYPGSSTASFELVGESNRTKLIVTAVGIETFPQEIPEFSHESCCGGWIYFMRRLKKYLES